MNTRIRKIRNDNNLTQETFASRLSLTRNYISLVEKGERVPSDRTISDICREFSVNEEWIRTGTGPIYKIVEDKLSAYVSEITDGDDDFIKDLIMVYMELDESSKKALKKLADGMAKRRNKKRDQV